MKKLLPLLITLLVLQACSGTSDDPVPVRVSIPAAVDTHVQNFLAEGKKRGVDLPLDNLVIELTGPVKSGNQYVCASTWGMVLTGHHQTLVQIDTQCNAWRYGGPDREILLFHELGHALMGRQHKDGRFPSGDLKSLMATDWNIGDFYAFDAAKRPYYLDEMFDPATPMPEWGE